MAWSILMNPLHPNQMTTAERHGELASILAAGLIRLRARQSSKQSADRGDSCLDFPGRQSGHEPVDNPTESYS
jgi:hypothetical protein